MHSDMHSIADPIGGVSTAYTALKEDHELSRLWTLPPHSTRYSRLDIGIETEFSRTLDEGALLAGIIGWSTFSDDGARVAVSSKHAYAPVRQLAGRTMPLLRHECRSIIRELDGPFRRWQPILVQAKPRLSKASTFHASGSGTAAFATLAEAVPRFRCHSRKSAPSVRPSPLASPAS